MSYKATVLCLILHRDKSSLPRLSRSLPVATEAPMVLVVPSMGCTFWGGRRSRSCPRMEGGRPSFSRPYWPSWRALCVSGACPLRPPARGSLSSPLPAPLAPPSTGKSKERPQLPTCKTSGHWDLYRKPPLCCENRKYSGRRSRSNLGCWRGGGTSSPRPRLRRSCCSSRNRLMAWLGPLKRPRRVSCTTK